MAHFQRSKTGNVKIKYYDAVLKKYRYIPRTEMNFLDDASDDDVRKWIKLWEQEHGRETRRALEALLLQSDEAQILFNDFLLERTAMRNLSPSTVGDERCRFNRYIAPFFIGEHKEKNVRLWENLVGAFGPALLARDHLEVEQIKKVLGLLSRFGKYLAMRQVISRSWNIPLPTRGRSIPTPLQIRIQPHDILRFAVTADPWASVMALLGYFASLRPGETFGLEKKDFYTGVAAKRVAKTYARFQAKNLGSGLSVHINKTLNKKKKGTFALPKTHYSYGYVNIWHSEAAKILAAHLANMEDGSLFDRSQSVLFRRWADTGQKVLGVSLHDLRRASGLFLGRTVAVELTLLQDHLRHSDIETTVLYTRNPSEVIEENIEQDWLDVG